MVGRTMGPCSPAGPVFYNRGGPGRAPQTRPLSPTGLAEKSHKGEGRGRDSVRTGQADSPPDPQALARTRSRGSLRISGPRLNGCGGALIYGRGLSGSLEKGLVVLCLPEKGQWATRARVSRDALGPCLSLALSSPPRPAAGTMVGDVPGDRAGPLEVP